MHFAREFNFFEVCLMFGLKIYFSFIRLCLLMPDALWCFLVLFRKRNVPPLNRIKNLRINNEEKEICFLCKGHNAWQSSGRETLSG